MKAAFDPTTLHRPVAARHREGWKLTLSFGGRAAAAFGAGGEVSSRFGVEVLMTPKVGSIDFFSEQDAKPVPGAPSASAVSVLGLSLDTDPFSDIEPTGLGTSTGLADAKKPFGTSVKDRSPLSVGLGFGVTPYTRDGKSTGFETELTSGVSAGLPNVLELGPWEKRAVEVVTGIRPSLPSKPTRDTYFSTFWERSSPPRGSSGPKRKGETGPRKEERPRADGGNRGGGGGGEPYLRMP